MCRNNLKCVVLALQTYHEYHGTFPMGVMHAGPSPGGEPPIDVTLGPSWWFGVLPFAENRVIHDQIMQTQRPGGPERHAFCADDMNAAEIPLDRFVPDYMRCLSSPLPLSESVTGPILLPSYVGIAGGCDIDPDSLDYPPDMEGRDILGKSVLRKMSPQLGSIRCGITINSKEPARPRAASSPRAACCRRAGTCACKIARMVRRM